MAMLTSNLKVAVISDVHLGHDKTDAAFITQNLYRAFPDNELTGELDIIWIAGDLFDRRLSLPDDGVSYIHEWATRFLSMCKRRDIVVRVLEGTPSHDWKQAELLVSINENAGIHADLRHITALEIEHIERFGIDVLYIPDEWRAKNIDTWIEVQELMTEKQLTHVDFSIMHGAFTHQIPANIVDMFETHNAEHYLDITRYLIFIGHIHHHSQYERILAAGSFDRLHHGEEEPKGHIRATVEPSGEYQLRFVENTGARMYQTRNYTGVNIDEVYRDLDGLTTLPENSNLRIQANTDDAVFSAGRELKARYPKWRITFKSNDRKEKIQPTITKEAIQTVNLSYNNILVMMSDKLKANHKPIADRAVNYLKETLDEYDQSGAT